MCAAHLMVCNILTGEKIKTRGKARGKLNGHATV